MMLMIIFLLAQLFALFRKWSRDANGKAFILHFLWTSIYNITKAEDAEEVLQSQSIIRKSVGYFLLEPFLGEGLLVSTGELLICCLDRANGDSILLKMLHYDFSVHTAQNEASIEKLG